MLVVVAPPPPLFKPTSYFINRPNSGLLSTHRVKMQVKKNKKFLRKSFYPILLDFSGGRQVHFVGYHYHRDIGHVPRFVHLLTNGLNKLKSLLQRMSCYN